jgi:ADP-heptose:LPS heptosyltransferase
VGTVEAVDLVGLAAEECARTSAQLATAQAVLLVPGIAKLLRRAVRNLLENARRYAATEVELALYQEDAFAVIAGAALTVGVDTGLTHLAAVLGLPTVEIYCDSPRWKTEGYWAYHIRNVGDIGLPPDAAELIKASVDLLTRPT